MKKLGRTLLLAGAAFFFSCNANDKKESTKKNGDETVTTTTESRSAEGNSGDEDETASTGSGSPEAKATAELCDCFNTALGEMNPKVKRIIIEAGNSEEPAQTLQTEMLKITDKEEQEKIATQFQQFQNDPNIQDCSDKIKKKYKLDDSDTAAQRRVLQAAEANDDCEIVYALMQIGLKQTGQR